MSRINLQNIVKSELFQNSARLLTANVVAQAIGLLVYPILTRLYSPEDFGLLNLFMSIVGVFTILATAEYQNAIMLPEDNKQARGVVHVCMLVSVSVTLVLGMTIFFSTPIANIFVTPNLAKWYWAMPLVVFFMSMWNILNCWYNRRSQYKRISGYQMSQSIFSSGYKVMFGALGITSGGLILSSVLAPFCSLVLSLSLAWGKHIKELKVIDIEECKKVAKRYGNFPKYSMPRGIVNFVAGQLPVLILTPVFGSTLLGFWAMALLIAFMPISMITRAIYQVLFQRTAERVQHHVSIIKDYKKFTCIVLCLAIFLIITLYYPMPWLVQFVLGEQWLMTGNLIRWMFPWLTFAALTNSTGFLPDVFGQQKIELGFEILMASLRTAGVLLGLWKNDFMIAIIGYIVGSAIVSCARYAWQMSLVYRYEKTL